MQGIDATLGGVSFDRERNALNGLPQFIIGAAALVSIGCVAAYLAHNRLAPVPGAGAARPSAARAAAPAIDVASNQFGEMIIEPGWLPKAAPPVGSPSAAPGTSKPYRPRRRTLRRRASNPRRQRRSFSRTTSRSRRRATSPEFDDSAPLPPPRPPEFGEPVVRPGAPERRVAQPGETAAPAPGDNPNLLQRLLGLVRQPGATVASAPPGSRAPGAYSRTVASAPVPTSSGETAASSASSAGTFRQGAFRLFLFGVELRQARIRSADRNLRHLGPHRLSPGRKAIGGPLGPWRQTGRSPLRERAHGRAYAAARV